MDDPDNCVVRIIHYKTGEIIETMTFYDPYLGWAQDEVTKSWFISMGYSCGMPTTKWLLENPCPIVRR